MVSHGDFGLLCVFSFAFSRRPSPGAEFRRCFGGVSKAFRRLASPECALATLRGVNVDRAELARVLGTEIPRGVEGVRGVAHDSRLVEPGFAFVAIPGFKRDGASFALEALRRGASLIVAEREIPRSEERRVGKECRSRWSPYH